MVDSRCCLAVVYSSLDFWKRTKDIPCKSFCILHWRQYLKTFQLCMVSPKSEAAWFKLSDIQLVFIEFSNVCKSYRSCFSQKCIFLHDYLTYNKGFWLKFQQHILSNSTTLWPGDVADPWDFQILSNSTTLWPGEVADPWDFPLALNHTQFLILTVSCSQSVTGVNGVFQVR